MHRPRPGFLIAIAVVLCLLPGCVAERQRQKPPRAPSDLQPRMMVIALHTLLDDDNNGYPDTLPLVIYLWDDRYPLPLWGDGSMHFELKDELENVLAEWDVPADVVRASRRRDQVGAVHLLTLDIRDATTDARPPTTAQLSGEYMGLDGSIARSVRPMAVRIGG